jgi:CRP-like cAMP-binding protein
MISRVYFPHTGVVSLIVGLSGGQFIEAGMFGRNSVIGVGALLDGPFALNQAIGQVGGSGMGADVSVLRELMERSKTLRSSLAGYERMFSAHAQQVAACNAVHELDERLGRWLLQVRDLLKSDDLPLTQEFLSQMHGVQRSSVTLVARRLQQAGLIAYRRGKIRVLDADALHESSCECYDAINGQFHRLVGWTPS